MKTSIGTAYKPIMPNIIYLKEFIIAYPPAID